MGLREKTLSAVRWNLLSTMLSTSLGIMSLWILSHWLTTQDYGVISAALIISTFFTMLLDFGISNSIVRSKNITIIELSSLYVINILLGIVICSLVFIFSNNIANLFKANEMLISQIKIMSFGFVILAFSLQPRALLTREMNFSAIAKISIITVLTNFIIVISLAWFYRSPWCIAVGFLISSIVNAVASKYATRSQIKYNFSFQFSSIKKHFRYGLQLVLDSIVNQISINTYPVLMSRLINLTAIGGYNIAYSISIALFEKLNPVLSHTLFPVFSKISDDESKLQSSFLRVTTYAAMINFPMLLGMMLIAKPLISLFFDEKWWFIIPIVKILCVVGAIRSLDTSVISILLVKAQMYRNVLMGLAKIILGIPLTWILGRDFGILGIVYGFLIIQILNTFFGYFFLIKPSIHIRGVDYIKSICVPFFHVIPMISVGMILLSFLPEKNNIISLATIIITCFLTFVVTIILSPIDSIKEFKSIISDGFFKKVLR
ncbi:MOP flippase family protein [Pectobacterium cacticida]|uniref:MOP flippase family protein n=1 Tax=Pectobacterium cacticida TaxID=69221 RepID=UPI002FEE6F59